MPYDQPQIPLDQQDPDASSLRLLLARYLPSLLGGGNYSRGDDVRLPMEANTARDPRLPPPGPFQAIREGIETVRSLGRGNDSATAAMQALKRRK